MAPGKRLLFVVNSGSGWTGGTYYVRNLIYTMLQNPEAASWNIFIFCPDEHRQVFESLAQRENVTILRRRVLLSRANYFFMKLFRVIKRDFPLDVVVAAVLHRIDYILPLMGYPLAFLNNKGIHWIPDFQHNRIPGFFSPLERIQKDNRFEAIGKRSQRLLLSSNDAARDFVTFFPDSTVKPIVIPFISDVEEWIERMTPDFETRTLEKYSLARNGVCVPYLYVPNQFWRHKNHVTAFRGIAAYLSKHPESNLTLVCTGNNREYRSPGFYENLMQEVKDSGFEKSIRIISFLSRDEQIVILKNSVALLQPSLFEGWGTGVQEAKRFAKPLLLSDIPIHREQSDSRTFFFSSEDPLALAEAISKLLENSSSHASMEDANKEYHAVGREYAKNFNVLLGD